MLGVEHWPKTANSHSTKHFYDHEEAASQLLRLTSAPSPFFLQRPHQQPQCPHHPPTSCPAHRLLHHQPLLLAQPIAPPLLNPAHADQPEHPCPSSLPSSPASTLPAES